jgi:NADP-dependent 3-hydroxy acid dehydrogenase YdfG
MMVFTNKIAVITGAASGIGAGLAREAARRGMRVVLADRNVEALSAVANEIGEAATAIPTDVTNASAVEALAEAVFQRHGAVDLLFNNAGVMTTGLSWEIPPEKWEASWKVNVEGILNGLRAFVPRMIAADRPARTSTLHRSAASCPHRSWLPIPQQNSRWLL